MPELTVIHIGLLALMLVIGAVIGWLVRADRCAREKIAMNATWQDEFESQQSEHNRLAEQNKSLMEQISQYQASQKDHSNRAKELSDSLQEAFARRDELQRQLKDVRGSLEVAVAQRDRLRGELKNKPKVRMEALKEKDDKIFRLSRELTSWQSRVPPLVERFQEKDREARALEEELDEVQARLQVLEELVKSDQTRIEPLDAKSLPDGGDASNEPIAMTSAHDASLIQDQIGEDPDADLVAVDEFVEPVEAGGIEPVGDDKAFDAVFANEDGPDDDEVEAKVNESAFDTVFAGDGEDAAEVVDIGVLGDDEDPEEDDSDKDDLQMIKGIGPSIEKTLNDLGVYRFHQIAEMSEYEIDRVAQQLKGFRSRVYREDWIGQARDFQYQKNSDRS